MSKLVISLPTRGRPDRLLDTVRRSVANWTHPETMMVIHIDRDDFPTMAAVQALHAENPRVVCTVEDREDTIAAKWNRALRIPADLYLAGADDDPYVTVGYDSRLLAAAERFQDGIGMVYGHMANASFTCAVAPTRGLIDKLGHMFPEYFPYWFVDHWTDDIARMIGRISFADVRTDQTNPGRTQEMREPGWWGTWFDAAYLIRRQIATDIINGDDFDEMAHTKQRLLAHAPLIEYRSKWINDQVRGNEKNLVAWAAAGPPDDRYSRLKQRAVDMIPDLLKDMDPVEALRYRNALMPPVEIQALPQMYQGMAA